MIIINKLCKSYGDKQALDNLSLDINPSSIFGLLGPNGAGKTTLISILNGLTTFDSGEVLFFGLPLSTHLKQIRQRCSLVPQSLAFYENLTVLENLTFFASIQKIDKAIVKQNIAYAVEINRLGSMLKQKAGTLSGGQKRRLNIAIGLLNNPDVLFFDEPTVGIDPESRNEILETISHFKQDNKCVIYTSHYMPEIEKICDHVAIINAGQIIKQGDMSSMLATDNADQLIIELFATERQKIELCCAANPLLTMLSENSLSLNSAKPDDLSVAITALNQSAVRIKQVNFATTNLESLFINLTSKGR